MPTGFRERFQQDVVQPFDQARTDFWTRFGDPQALQTDPLTRRMIPLVGSMANIGYDVGRNRMVRELEHEAGYQTVDAADVQQMTLLLRSILDLTTVHEPVASEEVAA